MAKTWFALPALTLLALIAGCGGGSSTPAAPSPTSSKPPLMPMAGATIVLNGTPPGTLSTKSRRPTFIDSANATQLLVTVATVNGVALNTTTSYAITGSVVTCSGSPQTCTLNTALPTGVDDIQVTLEDAGNMPLAQNNVTTTVVQGTNTVYLTLNPIVATLSLSMGTSEIGFGNGTGYSMPVTITAKDAAGATITGPGLFAAESSTTAAAALAPLTISSSDIGTTFSVNNGTAAATVSVNSPSDTVWLFHSAGGGKATATVTDSAARSITATQSATPTWLYVTTNVPDIELFDTFNNVLPFTTVITPPGTTPRGLAFAGSSHLYVANNGGTNTVTEYDTNNANALIATLTGLNGPQGVAYDSTTGLLFVANNTAGINTISVFQTATNTLFTTLTGATAFNRPSGIAIDSNRNLYVANSGTTTVNEYPLGTLTGPTEALPTLTHSYAIGVAPTGVAVSAGQLYVSTANSVLVYNTTTFAAIPAQTITLTGAAPADIFINPATGLLYVPLSAGTTIPVYQTNTGGTAFTLVTTFTANGAPFGAALQ